MERILFVDDEPRVLDGIRRMLYAERSRWEMEFVLSGEAALEACRKKPFNVVVSDMRMPGMDGTSLLGRIQELYPDTARIILSGYAESEAANRTVPVAHRFIAKPCDASELRLAIERVCAMQQTLASTELRKAVGAIGKLPSFSEAFHALTRVVNDPDASIADVSRVVAQDMAMSAKVLQLTNSAFFGLPQRISSLSHAVNYLGMDTIKNLALVVETFRVFRPDARIPRQLWSSMQEHTQTAAAIAAKLPLDKNSREAAVVAALLHDVGKLILAGRLPDHFLEIARFAQEKHCRTFHAEEELLGTSHAEIGAYLLGLWCIPDAITEAVAHHHRPTRIPHNGLDVSLAVFLADLFAHEQMNPHSIETAINEEDRASLETLGLWPRMEEFRAMVRSTPSAGDRPPAAPPSATEGRQTETNQPATGVQP